MNTKQHICIYCKDTGFHGDEFTGGESYCTCKAGTNLKQIESEPIKKDK